MAKLKANAVISGLSGDLGKDHYARYTKDGQTIISKKPDFSNRQFSEAQLEVQSGMRAAAAYAKVASRVNPIYAEKAEGTSKNAYNHQATHRGLVRVEAWDFASNVTRQEFRPSSPSDCWRRTSRRQDPAA